MTDDALRAECEEFYRKDLSIIHPDRPLNYIEQRKVDALLHLCQRQRAATWRAAALLGDEQSPHHMECALKWGRKCEAKAKECEAQAVDAENTGTGEG